MNPLSALRDFTVCGDLDKIVRVNDEFQFRSDYSFLRHVEIAYRPKQGNLYTLETFLYYVNIPHSNDFHSSEHRKWQVV
ncbi:hypothetical protein ACFX1Z_014829 [Malus domestica]